MAGFKRGSPSWWEERLSKARRAASRNTSVAGREKAARNMAAAQRGLERATERKQAQEEARRERQEQREAVREALPRGSYTLEAPAVQFSENPILYEPGDVLARMRETDLNSVRRLVERGDPYDEALAQAILERWWEIEGYGSPVTLVDWKAIRTPGTPDLIVN